MIDQPTVDRIIDAAQIVDVVSEFVSLKKRGVNYVGLCPFHDDKTPSFYVSPAKNLCKCFACGKGGSAVHFVMEHEQLTYPEALRWLANKYHIEIKERELSNAEKQAQNDRESLFVVNEFAKDYFINILNNHIDGKSIGMSYLRNRGMRDDIIKKFQIGYSTLTHDAIAKEAISKGYKKEFLIKTGICYEKEDGSLRDRFWGRIIFPVHTVTGKVVAFGGRVLNSDAKTAKYVNSPESEIYHKSNELYGIYFAKQSIIKQNKCFLVEGYMDVISMHQSGIENVVASSGTSLTPGQIKLLHRFTENITLLYDGDAAGIKASIRGIDMLLAEGLNIKVLLLPNNEDPDSFSKKHSSSEFQRYIAEHEENFIMFKTQLLLNDAKDDPIKRAALIADLARSIGLIPNDIVRYACLKECASILNVDERVIMNEIKKHVEQRNDKLIEDAFKQKNGGNIPSIDDNSKTEEVQAAAANIANEIQYQSYIPEVEREKLLFYQKEQMLIQTLIRHGEKVMCIIDTEETKEYPMTVIEYIASDLKQDDIQFHNPIHRKVLSEACSHLHDNGFICERYFLAHPDPEISRLAADMLSSRYQLSKYHAKSQKIVEDEERLFELVPHLITDFKFAILQEEMKHTLQALGKPEVVSDAEKSIKIMEHYKELSEIQKEMAKRAGDRVVLKA
ncbi:DNA primase [Phocaeicola paurosaccharolyticus]|uniref:DNA primase n=1 Tax=Phocaeicola paurosaccharolyticus TaxID=732242 RepID=UPI00046A5E76|nr:DNA primase [Phocaeicola paurosaccharolyticus]